MGTKKGNIFNKFWKLIHVRNLVLAVAASALLLYVNEHYWPKSKFFEEFIIVFVAAFAVSAYFEFYLRRGISEENLKIFEMKEELGKAGVIKYIPNFKDLVLRDLFREDVKHIDIYVHFADTVFNQVSDEIYKFCQKENCELNIYMLSPENKFILGLGELWGSEEAKYNEDGIKAKINSAQQTLTSVFNQLNKEGKFKAKVTVSLLNKNPVFYSFYRFDDNMVYVPSKIVAPRTIVPPAFLIRKTFNDLGLFNKCLAELSIIKSDANSLTVFFKTK